MAQSLLFQPVVQQRRSNTPEHVGLPLGSYEEKRKKLQEERQNEYKAMIAQVGLLQLR